MDKFEEAVSSDRVPISLIYRFLSLILPLAAAGVGLYFLYLLQYTDWIGAEKIKESSGLRPVIYFVSTYMIGLGLFIPYSNRNQYRLTFLPSNNSLAVKQSIIHALQVEYDWDMDKEDKQCYRFYELEKGRRGNLITIIFDETGYYVNRLSIKWGQLNLGRSKKVVARVAAKITELEHHEIR